VPSTRRNRLKNVCTFSCLRNGCACNNWEQFEQGTAVLAKRHFDQTIKELFEHIGYKLPLNINFIFSADLTELIDASYAAFDGQVSKQRLSDSLSQLCPGKSLDGAMSPTLIVVCGHAFDPNSGAGRLPVRDLRILIAHEAVHDIQHQLSGPVMKDARPTPRGEVVLLFRTGLRLV
jgi:hypothetical protein